MSWTGFDFGDAWPYLAAGYGLFFAALAVGFVLIARQRQQVSARERLLKNLKKP